MAFGIGNGTETVGNQGIDNSDSAFSARISLARGVFLYIWPGMQDSESEMV